MKTKPIQELEFIKKVETSKENDNRCLFLYKHDGFLWVNAPAQLGSVDFRNANLMKPKAVFLSNMVDILVRNDIAEEVFNELNGDYMVEYMLWKFEV